MTRTFRSKGSPRCDMWMDMMAARSQDPMPESFAAHLDSCPTCREAWSELRGVWEALALDSEEMDVPPDLKAEVMAAVFGSETGQERAAESTPGSDRAADPTSDSSRPVHRLGGRRWRFLGYSGASAVLLAGCITAILLLTQHAAPPLPDAVAVRPSAAPPQATMNWSLVAYSKEMPGAVGEAALYQDGSTQKMVIQMSGLQPTSDGHVYQAWLLDNGLRYNCGTFAVDASGKGSLVYDIDNPYLNIDGIGITLEPDANGDAPRGPKVAGTPKST